MANKKINEFDAANMANRSSFLYLAHDLSEGKYVKVTDSDLTNYAGAFTANRIVFSNNLSKLATSNNFVFDGATAGLGAANTGNVRLLVQGLGTTSATSSFTARNSAGNNTLVVRDDGHVLLRNSGTVATAGRIYFESVAGAYIGASSYGFPPTVNGLAWYSNLYVAGRVAFTRNGAFYNDSFNFFTTAAGKGNIKTADHGCVIGNGFATVGVGSRYNNDFTTVWEMKTWDTANPYGTITFRMGEQIFSSGFPDERSRNEIEFFMRRNKPLNNSSGTANLLIKTMIWDGAGNIGIGQNIDLRYFKNTTTTNDFDTATAYKFLNTIAIEIGQPPVSGGIKTDVFYMYSADADGAGTAAPHFYTENNRIIRLYQYTTSVASATYVPVASSNIQINDTFDGYTIAQVVRVLKNLGFLQ